MKNVGLKNFLSGVSVAVVSLLATTSPSSSISLGELLTKKTFSWSRPLISPKGGKPFVFSGKPSLFFSRGNQALPATSFAFPKGSPFYRGQSLASPAKQPLVFSRGNQALSTTSFAFPKGNPFYRGQSLASPPKQQPLVFPRGNQVLSTTSVAFPKGGNLLRGQSLASPVKQSPLLSRGKQSLAPASVVFAKGSPFFGGQSHVFSTAKPSSLRDALSSIKNQAILHQQEVARQQEIAHQQQEAWNRLTPTERLLRTPFVRIMKPTGEPLERLNENTFAVEEIQAVDLGYGQGRSRTRQYNLNMALPAAPAFHVYQPGDNLVGFSSPAYTLNFKLPQGYHNPNFSPAALNVHLQGRDPNTIDYFVVVQDAPWDLNAAQGLQFRPQSYFDPESEYSSFLPSSTVFPARIGVFSRNPGGPLIQGQVDGALLAAPHEISIHNGVADLDHPANAINVGSVVNIALRGRALAPGLTPQERHTANLILGNLARTHQPLTVAEGNYVRDVLKWRQIRPNIIGDPQFISSGNAHPLVNFDMNDSRVLWSVAERLDGNRRMAVTKHILLTPAHNTVFEEVLRRPNVNTYQDVQRELQLPQTRNRLVLGGGGNLVDEFDIPVR